jgi:glycosyltransferase involved in cell wall biosynthesis
MDSLVRKYSARTRHGQWMEPVGQADLASIIIPTYNRALLLEEALASAAAQTYRPLEIIVVDDGSIDDTEAAVDRWRDRLGNDLQVTVRYCRQSNSGVSSARNHGLIESKGNFIQFLDSDDVLNPEKLSLQINCLTQNPACGYVFSDWTKLEEPIKWGSVSADNATLIDSAELYCSPRVKWTMVGMYRRKTVYEAGPYCEDMNTGEDKEFNLRVLLTTAKLVCLPGNLFASRDHAGPRLTDVHKVSQDGIMFAIRLHRRMTESALAEGQMDNSRLVDALIKGLTNIMIDAIEAGRRDLATEAIEICRKMPIGIGRRIRLVIYRILSLLPQGAFQRAWAAWLKIRRTIVEIPKRELRRLGDASRVGK